MKFDENIWLFIFIILLIIIYFMIPDNTDEKESYKIENFSTIDTSLKSNEYYFKNNSTNNSIIFEIKDNNSEPLNLNKNDIIELILSYIDSTNNIQFKKFYFKVLNYNKNILTLYDINTDSKKPFTIPKINNYNIIKKNFDSLSYDFYLGEFNFIGNYDNNISDNIFFKLFDESNNNVSEIISFIDRVTHPTGNTPTKIVFKKPFQKSKLEPNKFIKLYYYENSEKYTNKEDNIQYMQIINYDLDTGTITLRNADNKSMVNGKDNDFLKILGKFYIIFEIIEDDKYGKSYSNKIIEKYQKAYSSSLSANNYMDTLIEKMNKKVNTLNKMIKTNEKIKSKGNNQSIIHYFTKIILKYKTSTEKNYDYFINYYEKIIEKIKTLDYNIESGKSFQDELDLIFMEVNINNPHSTLKNLNDNLIEKYIDEIIQTNNLDLENIDLENIV